MNKINNFGQTKLTPIKRGMLNANEGKNMEKSKGCGCDHIKGIRCDVKNCAFNAGDSFCTAGEISVGPAHATDSDETACITFRKKDGFSAE